MQLINMFYKFFFFLFFQIVLFSPFSSAAANQFFLQQPQRSLFVNNRILAMVNGKAISAVDIMKKMDLIFYREFPQYSSSSEARYQFYHVNWKHVLKEMIEKELILADGQEMQLEVSHGDIRQQMEDVFGPNIIANLEKAGLTYEEAWNMVKEELLLRRMMMMRVNSKAFRAVTPSHIRAAYEEYAKNNPLPASWRYQILSFRASDPTACAKTAEKAYTLVAEENVPLEELQKTLNQKETTVTISEQFVRTEKEISASHRSIISKLTANTFSHPVEQQSRSKKGSLFRIFRLIAFIPEGPPPLSESQTELKNKLIERQVDKEASAYISKLYKHFSIQGDEKHPLYPKDFEPFTLQ